MIEKKIGRIKEISFGYGGYNEGMIGISFTLGSDKDHWGVSDFKGTWADRCEGAEWSEEDQIKIWGETILWLRGLLKDSKKININDLNGVPVEVTFEDRRLQSWRILTEVI